MINGLTQQDVNVLLDVVETWEREDNGPPSSLFVMLEMIGQHDAMAKARMEAVLKARQAAADTERRTRKERGIMLRAKLIMLRDSLDAEDFIKSV